MPSRLTRSPPARADIAGQLRIARVVCSLWKERPSGNNRHPLEPTALASQLGDCAAAGLDTIELELPGNFAPPSLARTASALAVWSPAADGLAAPQVKEQIADCCTLLGRPAIDLLQLHWRDYTDPAYLDAVDRLLQLRATGQVAHIGVTHFDTDHLHLLLRHGVPIATNRVSLSLLDRRATGRMAALCQSTGVQLLAGGTLAGGLLSAHWLGRAEPVDIPAWGASRTRQWVDAIGGWPAVQSVLEAAQQIAVKHGVSIADVARRWVLEQPAVAAIVIGVSGSGPALPGAVLPVFGFRFDADDHARLRDALAATLDPPGDCGAEQHRPRPVPASTDSAAVTQRLPMNTGDQLSRFGGCSQALRRGNRILVGATNAMRHDGSIVARGDAQAQAVHAIDKIAASLQLLGAGLEHVVRTRMYLRDAAAWQGPAQVHGRVFADIRPAHSVLVLADLLGDCEVEIEAEAELPPAARSFVSSGTPYEAMAGYSRAVVDGEWVFVSGTVGVDPATGIWASTTQQQAHRAIDTIEAALLRAGFDLLDVVRVVVYLASRDDVAGVSEVIRQRFGPARPTNTTLCVPLALEQCRVEIEVTAKRRTV